MGIALYHRIVGAVVSVAHIGNQSVEKDQVVMVPAKVTAATIRVHNHAARSVVQASSASMRVQVRPSDLLAWT